eukprot:symbB.v1.2.025779.t1/scaffold2336.1/size96545/4
MIYTAKSMDGQVLNQVAELARAATQAATAATAIASQFSSRGSSSMESAVKVLKAPDTLTGDDSFMNWKTSFVSWIGYGDERYLKLIPTVEKMTKAPDISTYKEEDKELAHKFYAILSSYLRGPCSSLVRAECENRDGFKLWYDLMREFHPQTKQRTLSLAQTLASYPSFSAKQSLLENILNYETLVDQYEKSSGEKYPSDLKTATLLRCAPQKIREFLQLTLRDDVTYMDMKEALLSHERITKGYSQEAILKQLSAGANSGHDTSDATPMEVDRVFEKGKGKEQGKKVVTEKVKDGGTTCGNFLVDVAAAKAKAVAYSTERAKEKVRKEERKEESRKGSRRARTLVEKVPTEMLALCVEAMTIGAVTVRGRCVTNDIEVGASEPEINNTESEPLWAQTVLVKVEDEFDLAKTSDWELSETGTPYRIQRGRRFCDPRHMWGRFWPYRSTLIRKTDSVQWELVDHELDDCSAMIPECSPGLDYDVLTIVAVAPHEVSYIGSLSDEQPITGVIDIPEVEGVGDPNAEAPREMLGAVAAPQLEGVVAPDEIVINDIVLKPTSPVKDLRAAAKFLGVSQAGSKTRMIERICSCHFSALRRRSLELAEQKYAEEEVPPEEAYSATRQPSERERRLHEITHLPFRKWCPFCIAGKVRAGYKHKVEADEIQHREHPPIQLDIMFGPGGNPVLLLIDTWTKYVFTAPMKNKSATTVADAISEFLGALGYFRKIEIASDNEPVVASGIKQAQILRSKSGLETIVQHESHLTKDEQQWQNVQFKQYELKDMYGISQKKSKYKAQWVKGIWAGKYCADQDILIIENDKILKSRAVRATGLFWSKDDLMNMEVSPDHMLKIATQTKGIYPVIPPSQCLPPRSDDEAASDPPDDQGGESLDLPEMISVPSSADETKPRLPTESRSPFEQRSPLSQRELSQLPFSAGILPEGDEGPTKRGLESEDSKRDVKQPKVKSYSEKRVSFDPLEAREPKQSRTNLQSSPTCAGNIRFVAQFGDVDVYVEPDEDGFEVPHEECFLHLNDDGYDDEEDVSELQLESQGPPELTDDEIAQLDREASLEELVRLGNIGVISEYSDVSGDEMILDTRLVFDWHFREGRWKRRARLEEEVVEVRIPPCSDDQRIWYLSRVAEMFYVTMTGQHDEHEVRRRLRGGEIPSDAVHETLYQLQLLTQALMDGHYQVAAEMMELANMDDVNERQIHGAIRRLKDTYLDTARGSFTDIGNWLYTKHGEYLRDVGRNLTEIDEQLGIANPEPDEEPHFEIDQDELDPDGMLEVESAHDRLIRYQAMPLEECSDPELWMQLHHWGETDSDDM